MTDPTAHRSDVIGLALLLGGLALSRMLFYYMLPIYDDAFITWRYAMNLLEQGVYTYNLDEIVLGTTAPLFGLLVAAGTLALGPPEGWVPFLNIALDCALVLLAHRVLFGRDIRATALFALLFAASPICGRIAVGGMEANLFALMALVTFTLVARERAVPAAILAALSVFVRPEGALIAVAGFGLLAFARPRLLVPYVLTGLGIGAVGGALLFATYGSVLPQSVVAKSDMIGSAPMDVVRDLALPDALSPLLVPLALLGLLFGRDHSRVLWLFNAWCVAYFALYLIAAPMIWSWYALPVQLFLIVNAARGLARLAALVPLLARLPSLAVTGASALVMVAFLAVVALAMGKDRITEQVYSGVAAFCAGLSDPDATILADDIGIVGYHCRPHTIIDTAGLVWPSAKDYPDDIAIAAATQPDYIMFASFRWKIVGLTSSGFADDYRYLYRLNRDGKDDSPLVIEALNDDWVQEYFFFERSGG